MNFLLQIDISYAQEALKCEVAMTCVLKIDVSYAREALKFENRYGMLAKSQY